MKTHAHAYAKVNFTLDVLGRRADGYHALRSVMLAVDLFDELTLDFDAADIRIEAEPALPAGSNAERAARAYLAHCPGYGLYARIARHIPPEAGLGGSSADAAGILLALQARHRALDEAGLLALAALLGSDVPFLTAGGIALCEGTGEKITPLPFMELPLLLVQPARGASTREVFARLLPPYPAGTSDGAVEAIRRGDFEALLPNIANGLTGAACALVPEIAPLLARMREAGARAASMTGSGSAVFGLFDSLAAAQRAARAFPDAAFVHACSGRCNMV